MDSRPNSIDNSGNGQSPGGPNRWLNTLYSNHVLANLTFVLLLGAGIAAYIALPREQNPSINFNWVQITTVFPGASAEDVEQIITSPLEEAIRSVQDIRFSSSVSAEGSSAILIRFDEIDDRSYDKRVNDLRRVVLAKADRDLPAEVETPVFFELNTANVLPAAMIMVSGAADDEVLRRNARDIRQDLERISGVESVAALGLHSPELVVEFYPDFLRGIGSSAGDVADTVSAYFRDTVAGKIEQGDQQWLARVSGTSSDPATVAAFPVVTAAGETPLGSIAKVSRARAPPSQLVRFDGRPGVLMIVGKKSHTSSLALTDKLKSYISDHNTIARESGVSIALIDDQTPRTRSALRTMETNAVLGLGLVILTVWMFLGWRISIFVGLGIPFSLAGTFVAIYAFGQSLNVSVFLGIVISLGMLVDDAVVVVEAIHYRLQQGVAHLKAIQMALHEVAAPVFASALTTMAAFLPLMLTPGLLGKFMFVIPLVVTIALAISLVEAFWMLPIHTNGVQVHGGHLGDRRPFRQRATGRLRLLYGKMLASVLRRPKTALLAVLFFMGGAITALSAGWVRADFFADDPVRLFYVNIRMPPSTPLDETLRVASVLEDKVKSQMRPGELRNTVIRSGGIFTATGLATGDHYGAVIVSLMPEQSGMRSVDDVIDVLRADLLDTAGPERINFLRVAGGPPVPKPVEIKVRGNNFSELRSAVAAIQSRLETIPGVRDIENDDVAGKLQLNIRLNGNAIKRAGLHPADVTRIVRLLFDGEIVANMQDKGEKLEVRVRALHSPDGDINAILKLPVALPNGGETALGNLVTMEKRLGHVSIRHQKFRRSITIEADIDTKLTDTVAVNQHIKKEWQEMRRQYPGIDLDYSGMFEDVQEGLRAMGVLFLLGIGLIYVILGAQFKSYWQPLLILATVPTAFSGVIYGLLISNNPLSLYTLYGVVALTGISVNTAIVLISAANDRRDQGASIVHATIFAARRRLIPVLITTLTTIAGLFSLATGLGGDSLLWGPLASAIVWGLWFSMVVTLFLLPLLYNIFMRRWSAQTAPA